jgi:hypothetical protein
MITRAWKPYANLKLEAKGLKKVITWGTKSYDAKENKE